MSKPASLTDKRFCHCRTCGRTFGGVGGFDRHLGELRRDGRQSECREPSAIGLSLRGDGVWVTGKPAEGVIGDEHHAVGGDGGG